MAYNHIQGQRRPSTLPFVYVLHDFIQKNNLELITMHNHQDKINLTIKTMVRST